MKKTIYFLLIVCFSICVAPLCAMEEENSNKALLVLVAKEASPESLQKIKVILEQGEKLSGSAILEAIKIAVKKLDLLVEKELPGCSISGNEVLLAIEEEKRVQAQLRSSICDSLVRENENLGCKK